ncbi:MAG TPA: YncE family protein [Fimbriimonadaceae bacterium]|nr:YncE family protein [Fimbriimonadaceae bacterium]
MLSFALLFAYACPVQVKPPALPSLKLVKTIFGSISPKSIVASGTGLFFAQNMMYTHKITVYSRDFKLLKTISDQVELDRLGQSNYKGRYQGAPVECAFSPDGSRAWVSNYQMYGRGFNHPGFDEANGGVKYDPSFLYKINTSTLAITTAVKVGSVPKFVAVTPDGKLVLVSNWAGYDLSVVDPGSNREVKRIKLGRFPRGIAVDTASQHAYVALLGGYDLADIRLSDYRVTWIRNVGRSPRHLCISPDAKYLYASLNGEGRVAKVDIARRRLIRKVDTGTQPRSMVLTPDGERLYVVNYNSNSVSQVRTSDMKVTRSVKTNLHPIGITYDALTHRIWVCCYSGSIMVFQEMFPKSAR